MGTHRKTRSYLFRADRLGFFTKGSALRPWVWLWLVFCIFFLVCVEFGLGPVGLGFLFCLLLIASGALVRQVQTLLTFLIHSLLPISCHSCFSASQPLQTRAPLS